MRKQTADLVRYYVRSLTDNELVWLYNRLHDRLGGDVGEAVQFMSKSTHMDKWLSTASTANDLYDMIDVVQQYASQDSRVSAAMR